jgi:hypothetical protein
LGTELINRKKESEPRQQFFSSGVEHGVKVFDEYVGIDADVPIEEYVLPAVPPN